MGLAMASPQVRSRVLIDSAQLSYSYLEHLNVSVIDSRCEQEDIGHLKPVLNNVLRYLYVYE